MVAGPVAAVVVVFIALTILLAAPVGAQEPTAIEMSVPDAAKVFGAAERVPGLVDEVGALRAENLELKAQIARLEKLAALDAELLARQERLTAFADQERDAWKGRAEQIAKDARKAGFVAKAKERCLEGGLIGGVGGSAVPGIGSVAGAVGGCVVGVVVAVVEYVIQGP